MKIWLDTTNVSTIRNAVELGMVAGITTNPKIIADDGRPLGDILKELLQVQEGPVTVQVNEGDAHSMFEKGAELHSMSRRIIVKVPVTKDGLNAIHKLSNEGIPTMATVVFSLRQALTASLAGADYIAPYVGRLEKSGSNPWPLLTSVLQIYKNHQLTTKILGASISSVEQVLRCAEIGIYGITIKDTLFEKLTEEDPLTSECLESFTCCQRVAE
jgi:transaldolase